MIRIAGIENDSITDGEGLRIVFFFQGCDKNCDGCQNPDLLPVHKGKEVSLDYLKKKIDDNPIIDGVTFSGGEPLIQAKELLPLADYVNEKGLSLWIYTGDVFEDIIEKKIDDSDVKIELLKKADVIVDGPYEKDKRDLTLLFRGSTNQRLLKGKESVEEEKAICVELN